MSEVITLPRVLRDEIKRVKEHVIPAYEYIGQAGAFVMSWLPQLIENSQKALDEMDAVEMVKCYKQLKEVKE